jgi:hypothetical protein
MITLLEFMLLSYFFLYTSFGLHDFQIFFKYFFMDKQNHQLNKVSSSQLE